MGMFNDSVSPQRTQWTYTYLGKDLFPHADRLYGEYLNRETVARSNMSEYMKDMNRHQNDPDIQRAKSDIQTYGTLKEQCAVFRHEFARNPEQTYELGLGDVTFFGIHEAPIFEAKK